MRKLVRDLIPDIIRATGRVPVVRRLSDEDYRTALRVKAQEELDELVDATGGDLVEELADLHEVLRGIAAHDGIAWSAVEAAATAKRATRGGFDERVWLEDVVDA